MTRWLFLIAPTIALSLAASSVQANGELARHSLVKSLLSAPSGE
jgi:hypothetical protein